MFCVRLRYLVIFWGRIKFVCMDIQIIFGTVYTYLAYLYRIFCPSPGNYLFCRYDTQKRFLATCCTFPALQSSDGDRFQPILALTTVCICFILEAMVRIQTHINLSTKKILDIFRLGLSQIIFLLTRFQC